MRKIFFLLQDLLCSVSFQTDQGANMKNRKIIQ